MDGCKDDPLRETKAQLDTVLSWVVSALEHEEQSQLMQALHSYEKAVLAISMVQTVNLPILASMAPSFDTITTSGDVASFQVLEQVLEGFRCTYQARIQSLEDMLLAQGLKGQHPDAAMQAHHVDSWASGDCIGQETTTSILFCNGSQSCRHMYPAQETHSWFCDPGLGQTATITAETPLATGSSQVGQQHQLQPAAHHPARVQACQQPQQQQQPEINQALLQQCGRNVSGTLDDLAGLESIKQELRQTVLLPLKLPHLFTGVRCPPRTLLMYGPPGTGKTLMVEKVAAEAGLQLLSLSPSSVLSRWSGDAEKTVRAVFSLAAACAPCALFIDEIDALAPAREGGGGGGGGNDVGSRRLLTELLLQLNHVCSTPPPGCRNTSHVYVFAATNRLQDCDVALLRRFSKRIHVPLPDEPGRAAFFQLLLKQPELAHDFGPDPRDQQQALESLVHLTKGYSFSDLSLVVKEAAMAPVKQLVHSLAGGTGALGHTSAGADSHHGQPQQQLSNAGITGPVPALRKLVLQDFVDALSKVKPAALDQQTAAERSLQAAG